MTPEYLPSAAELQAEQEQLEREIARDSDPRCAVCLGIHSWFMCPVDDSGIHLFTQQPSAIL